MTVLSDSSQDKLKSLLISSGSLSEEDLTKAIEESTKHNQSLFTYLVENKIVDAELMTKLTADILSLPYVNLSESDVKTLALNLLPLEVAERFMAVPLGEVDSRVVVAMLDANNIQAVDFLSNKIGRPVRVYMASEIGIKRVLDQYSVILDKMRVEDEDQSEETEVTTEETSHDRSAISQDSPISRTLTTIIEYAVRMRASDIHIEPMEKDMRVRCRIDGVLRETMRLPKSLEPALISRIKILASLKIDEHRVPQDGQFAVNVSGRAADLRIAISPVIWGEQVIIRILDKTGTSFNLEDLGYAGRALANIKKSLAKPNGMILTSGPTGSGKSTSLYALIQAIKDDSINIVTLEDPVEYKMEGVNQIQVNADVGLSFASGLRSILRQDPDVVLVGEIRDRETANLAIQAALTGHLVFSTLHTNSAAGVLPRLLDMDIEPFLIASTVRTVIGQRLARRLADRNVDKVQSNQFETDSINRVLSGVLPQSQADSNRVEKDIGYKNLPLGNQNAYTLYRGKDTPEAPGGYKGRVGLYEVLDVDEDIMSLIQKRATSSEIEHMGRQKGMITMQQDGYLKAITGLTTLEEVNRVAASNTN